jgi:CheY-like chemotaxis protein
MPKLNGHEVCRRIREQPWGRSIIVIALTGWGDEQTRTRAKEVGFNGHLTKPVDFNALTELIARLQATPK